MVASRVACDWHRGRAHDEALRERLVSRWARRPPEISEEQRVWAIAVAGDWTPCPFSSGRWSRSASTPTFR
ncbi:protein of unknown function [Streptomyces sp. KY75]|nr:protein of unknown function [Streptomyces sp. KY70]CAD5989704.1 protein of unknown function [Streptomyces sp. KY75]